GGVLAEQQGAAGVIAGDRFVFGGGGGGSGGCQHVVEADGGAMAAAGGGGALGVGPEGARERGVCVAAEAAGALAGRGRGAEQGGDCFVPDVAGIDAGAGGDAGHVVAGPREHRVARRRQEAGGGEMSRRGASRSRVNHGPTAAGDVRQRASSSGAVVDRIA